ncbi:hypothetical protein E1287_06295 [Actinomadura sp. KC06]|nr:hypothetical protein E1287_06295 [Actinomadura sp. KC06]
MPVRPTSETGESIPEGRSRGVRLRDTFNRLLGCLFHCLQTGRRYDERSAFGPRLTATARRP